MGSVPAWGTSLAQWWLLAVQYPPRVPPASLGQCRGRAACWPLPWQGRCQASRHGGGGVMTVPSPAVGWAGDARREAWERRDLHGPASAQPDSPRAASPAAPWPFGTATPLSYPHPRGETPKAAEPLSAGGGREGLHGAGVLPPPWDLCAGSQGSSRPPCASHTGAVPGRVELGRGGSGRGWKHAVLSLGTCCINRRFARAVRNVRAGAGSMWCGQGGPDPCAGQGGGQRGTL